jgi:hypothetical protein
MLFGTIRNGTEAVPCSGFVLREGGKKVESARCGPFCVRSRPFSPWEKVRMRGVRWALRWDGRALTPTLSHGEREAMRLAFSHGEREIVGLALVLGER